MTCKEVLQEDRSKGNQDSRRRDAGNTGYRAKDNGRRPGKQEEPKALVTLDGEGVDWTGHAEDEQENFALMAYSNSGSDTEILSKGLSKLLKKSDEYQGQIGILRSSDVEDSHVHDRFANVEGMHAVPPPMIRNYMPSGPDREVEDTYGSDMETIESMPEPVVVEPKVVSQPKVWSDAPIIKGE
ncbi:hypothetical protein Tco_0893429 [Tanacetum coccineum]|uniref:Uncharacterized protein n=1 Tax=Tanacetum coccineum TaxID=301880 RepID=A0ABQ5CBI7_9ASTR